jgi:hypothetical protein
MGCLEVLAKKGGPEVLAELWRGTLEVLKRG